MCIAVPTNETLNTLFGAITMLYVCLFFCFFLQISINDKKSLVINGYLWHPDEQKAAWKWQVPCLRANKLRDTKCEH